MMVSYGKRSQSIDRLRIKTNVDGLGVRYKRMKGFKDTS